MRTTIRGLPDRRHSRLLNARSWRDPCDSALCRAISEGRQRAVEALLQAGARVNVRDMQGRTVLIAALQLDRPRRRLSIVRMLILHGSSPVERDLKLDRDALGWATALARAPECELILADFMGDINLTGKDAESKTVLHLAVEAGSVQIVRILMKAFQRFNLSVDVCDGLGLTPLMHAQRLAFTDIAKVLVDDGQACVFHSDPFKYKNSLEWYREGIFERLRNTDRERLEKGAQNRILGKVIRPVNVPRVIVQRSLDKIDDVSSYADFKYASLESLPTEKVEYSQLDVDERNGESVRSLVVPKLVLNQRNDSQTIRSLIDMSSEQGEIPTHFHGSRSPRVVSDRHGVAYLSTAHILGVMAEQQTASFRMPFRQKLIPVTRKSDVEKEKVSTLAIIMGKQRKTSTRNKPKLKVPVESVRKKTPERKRASKAAA